MKIYFGIHKHMHQPYYRAADLSFWDGQTDDIFRQRSGAYGPYIADAVRRYVDGGLPHAGLSTSWSGSLIAQLQQAAGNGRCNGEFRGWPGPLAEMLRSKTALGNPRVDFTAFGYFHPLMPLIPSRDIVKQIRQHRDVFRAAFGVEAARILFPPETAFHVRMIPALREAGIEAVIYDSLHRARTCAKYPYTPSEGMPPPDASEQSNPEQNDWLQMQNVWAPSKISPSLLRPEYVGYEDADGKKHKIIAVPAERYLGNEDARGGFGALQYPNCLGQILQAIERGGSFDEKHPPFFLLHSDGDNHGGGTDSYYRHNTDMLVKWLQSDPRFELTTIRDYLQRFPPDPKRVAHIEPGSWAGADNGDPQFSKWFSRADQDYSPDLNSWAVLTALQNAIHTLEDAGVSNADAERLLLTAETSCYWYWTGQDIWDRQVTEAANAAWERIGGALSGLSDKTGPTIFPPWRRPGVPRVIHTFIGDVSGIQKAAIRVKGGATFDLVDHGAYPSRTGVHKSASYFTVELPAGLGNIRYSIVAKDQRGNESVGSLERAFIP